MRPGRGIRRSAAGENSVSSGGITARGIGIRRRLGATAGRVFGGEIDSRHGLQERSLHVAVPRRATSLCGRHMLQCPEVSARPGLSWAHSLSSFFAPILITRDEGVGGVLGEPFTATVLAEQTIRGASPDGEAPRIRGSTRSLVPRDRCGGPEGIRTPDLLDANEARYQLRHRPGQLDNTITPSGRAETIQAAQPAVLPPHMPRAACRVGGATAARAEHVHNGGRNPDTPAEGAANPACHRFGPQLCPRRARRVDGATTARAEHVHNGGRNPDTPAEGAANPACHRFGPQLCPRRARRPKRDRASGRSRRRRNETTGSYSPEARRASSRCT